jgi:hypothetical protein
MCSGNTWDASPEALSERISSLEVRIAEGGVFAPPRPTFTSNESIAKAQTKSVEEDLAAKKNEDPSLEKTAKISDMPIPAKIETPKQLEDRSEKIEKKETKREVSESGLEWTEFSEWIEIVSQYDKIDRSISPFLRLASADTDGKTLRIKVSDAFSKVMLENAKIEDFVMRFSASKGFMFSQIMIEVSAVQDDQVSMFDGLL